MLSLVFRLFFFFYLVFSEFPGSLFWSYTLIWGKFSVILVSFFFLFLVLFSFWNSHYFYVTFCVCSSIIGYSIPLKKKQLSLCCLYFWFLRLLLINPLSSEILSSHLLTNEPIRGILLFHYGVLFIPIAFFFPFFLGFSSLYLTCVSVFIY